MARRWSPFPLRRAHPGSGPHREFPRTSAAPLSLTYKKKHRPRTRTSLTRKCTPLGLYYRPMPRVLGGTSGGGRFLMSEVPLYTAAVSVLIHISARPSFVCRVRMPSLCPRSGEQAHTPYHRARGPAWDLSGVKCDPIATEGIQGLLVNKDTHRPVVLR